MSIIKCTNLTMGYEGKEVINNIDFAVNDSDYLCIVGENGSGKSTLIKGLLRIKAAISGSIEYGEGLCNKEIGFLPQQKDYLIDFPASVFEIVISGRINSMGIRPFYNKLDRITAEENLNLLGISEIRNNRFTDLSGGQRQRVLLARALCSTKRVMILDEPTAGLDPKITEELYDLIDIINKNRNITVIMVSHDIEHALNKANKILHLSNDNYFFGTVDEYMNSDLSAGFCERK